jgi:hypothetical protein
MARFRTPLRNEFRGFPAVCQSRVRARGPGRARCPTPPFRVYLVGPVGECHEQDGRNEQDDHGHTPEPYPVVALIAVKGWSRGARSWPQSPDGKTVGLPSRRIRLMRRTPGDPAQVLDGNQPGPSPPEAVVLAEVDRKGRDRETAILESEHPALGRDPMRSVSGSIARSRAFWSSVRLCSSCPPKW